MQPASHICGYWFFITVKNLKYVKLFLEGKTYLVEDLQHILFCIVVKLLINQTE